MQPVQATQLGVRWSTPERPAYLKGMNTNTAPVSGLERLLSIEELAEYLGVPVATLLDWRVDHKGPCAIIVGRRVKYAVSDVRAWLEQQRETAPGDGKARW